MRDELLHETEEREEMRNMMTGGPRKPFAEVTECQTCGCDQPVRELTASGICVRCPDQARSWELAIGRVITEVLGVDIHIAYSWGRGWMVLVEGARASVMIGRTYKLALSTAMAMRRWRNRSGDRWRHEVRAASLLITAAEGGDVLPIESRVIELEGKLRAADAVMEAIDRQVRLGTLDSRSKIADARLDYGDPS